MIRHVVAWQLATDDAAEKREQGARVAELLLGLDGVVPQIRAISAGPEALYPDANFDVALVADFDSREDLEAYQTHPAHLEVGAYVRSVVSGRVAVDFEL